MDQEEVWDSFYRANGRAWRGTCRLPDPLGGSGDALDLGCGSGKSLSSLMDLGYRVTGVDMSAEAVAICRDRFGGSVDLRRCGIASLPFGDGTFDYVAAVHVLGHLDDRDLRRAASEAVRVLRPGGYLFVRDFAPGDLRSGSRGSSDILYMHRTPDGIVPAFPGMDVVSSGIVEEPTRFGAVRRRTEVLMRRPDPNP